jgi:hypothetical protein
MLNLFNSIKLNLFIYMLLFKFIIKFIMLNLLSIHDAVLKAIFRTSFLFFLFLLFILMDFALKKT